MCMCVSMHTCVHTCVHAYVCVYGCMCICIGAFVGTCLCALVGMSAYVLVCTFVCTGVCKVCKGDFLPTVECSPGHVSLRQRGLLCINLPSIPETQLTSRTFQDIVPRGGSPDANSYSVPVWAVHWSWGLVIQFEGTLHHLVVDTWPS